MVKQSRVVVADLTRFTEKNMVRLTLESHANLAAAPSEGGTPVDTGWARANWVPNIGRELTDTVGSPDSVDSGSAQGALAEVASTYRLRQGPIFISNNVPYIQRLNDGSSDQAPKAFVQSAILRAIQAVVANPPAQP